MEEKSVKKPLRTSSNTEKDIKNTYLKNDGKKVINSYDNDNNEGKEVEEFDDITENREEESVDIDNDSSSNLDSLKEQIAQLELEKEELKRVPFLFFAWFL